MKGDVVLSAREETIKGMQYIEDNRSGEKGYVRRCWQDPKRGFILRKGC